LQQADGVVGQYDEGTNRSLTIEFQVANDDEYDWVVENLDLTSSRKYVADGKLTWREWARSFRGVEEAAWFARDDPKPFAAMCAQMGSAKTRRVLSRLRP